MVSGAETGVGVVASVVAASVVAAVDFAMKAPLPKS